MDRNGSEPTVRFEVDVSRGRWLRSTIGWPLAPVFFALCGCAVVVLIKGVHASLVALRDEGWFAFLRAGMLMVIAVGAAGLWSRSWRRFRCEIGATKLVAMSDSERFEISPRDPVMRRHAGSLVELLAGRRGLLIDLERLGPEERTAVGELLNSYGTKLWRGWNLLFTAVLYAVVGAWLLPPSVPPPRPSDDEAPSLTSTGPVRRAILFEVRDRDGASRPIRDDADLAATAPRCRWFTFHGRFGGPEFDAAAMQGFHPSDCRGLDCRWLRMRRPVAVADLLEMSRHRRIRRIDCHVDTDGSSAPDRK